MTSHEFYDTATRMEGSVFWVLTLGDVAMDEKGKHPSHLFRREQFRRWQQWYNSRSRRATIAECESFLLIGCKGFRLF